MLKNRKYLKIIILFIIFLTIESGGYYLGSRDVSSNNNGNISRENGKASLNALKARNSALRQKLKSLTPDEIYIVIDTGRNVLYLKRALQRSAKLSSPPEAAAYSKIQQANGNGYSIHRGENTR